MTTVLDPVVANEWFAVCESGQLTAQKTLATRLLDHPIEVRREAASGAPSASAEGAKLKATERYGYVWVTFGEPGRKFFELPEYDQPGRRVMPAGTFGVKASAPRIIENFLDMAHFPYVHKGFLGQEPHTEVSDCKVETRADTGEIFATHCTFWQPKSAASAGGGMQVDYTYRVIGPFGAILYKSSGVRPGERDVIGLYVQPMTETECRAHMSLILFDDELSDTEIIAFQQTIFCQDKPILENQLPKKIPLDPRAEMPTRADAMSAAYRRSLRESGLTYGVLPAQRSI